MTLKNRFTPTVRSLFAFRYSCDICGMNNNLELHHILGTISNSALNASLLCHKCHEKEDSGGEYLKRKLLVGTLKFLISENYELTEKDLRFYIMNRRLYEYGLY